MKTITIKLPINEAEKLDNFIKKKNYPSKSEFIRDLIRNKLEEKNEQKEQMGWSSLAEQSIQMIWDNKEDDGVWKQLL